MADDDWSDEANSSEDESGGMANRRKLMAMAKDSVAGSSTHDICPKCKKEVFLTTDRISFGDAFYHVACFRCQKCNETMRGGNHVDHQGKAYCKSCYDKHFRQKGYGFGGGTGTLSSEVGKT